MTNMHEMLKKQKEFVLQQGAPSIDLRIDRLNRMKELILDYRYKFVDALNEDFGVRSKNQSMITDAYSIIPNIEYAKKNIKSWTGKSKRKTSFPFNILGARSYVEYEPLGVVGMISPWNFPVNLTFSPLIAVFAAGNVVMHKPSEYTENTSALLKESCDKYFDDTEFGTVLGGPEVGAEFSSLKFDHLLYTGSGAVGKYIMEAAAKNLVPVTLELGGKSPVIVGESADLKSTARRVMMGKTMNAGQICLAPDYVIVKDNLESDLVSELKESVKEYYPDIKHNPDYTSIINQKHFDRINGLIDDARAKGATIDEINPANEDFSQQEAYKIPPTLVMNPTDDMKVMQEEIFGPVLPIKKYSDIDETIEYVNSKDKPLGLYYFGNNKTEEDKVLSKTTSGGVTVNNVIGHLQQSDLPFGGVGPSGIGRYNGVEGFLNFSNAKAVYKEVSPRFEKLFGFMRPPYKDDVEATLKKLIK